MDEGSLVVTRVDVETDEIIEQSIWEPYVE